MKTPENWKDLGIPTVGTKQTISERVKQYLKDQEKLLNRLTPKYVLDKAFGKDDSEKSLREVFDLFLKTPGMSLPENEEVLLNAVSDGAKTGVLGIREDTEVYYKQDVSPNIGATVLRGEVAKRIKEKGVLEEGKGEGEKAPLVETGKIEEIKKKEGVIKRLSLKAAIPWDKLSDLVKGVIRPLKDKGLPPKIAIEIEAESEDGFDRTTLDSTVRETLKQINAKIEKWEEL